MLRKVTVLLLSSFFALGLVACGEQKETTSTTTTTTTNDQGTSNQTNQANP